MDSLEFRVCGMLLLFNAILHPDAVSLFVANGPGLRHPQSPPQLSRTSHVYPQDLVAQFGPTDLCPDCEIIVASRIRHCNICGKCVERFDHHCPWINNCVGVDNHGVFYGFLLCLSANVVFSFCLTSYSKYLCG
jgi:hypothetical protein